jgi:ABC-type sugar transport system substrate-binding protein
VKLWRPGRAGAVLTIVFGVAVAVATLMNVTLINQARTALEVWTLGNKPAQAVLRYHLALVVPDTADAFFDGLLAGVEDAAVGAEAAVQVLRYRTTVSDDDETTFQLCVSSHLDGIIFYSGSAERIAERRTEAKTEGLVFIPVGPRPPANDSEGFIGTSSFLQGMESGNKVVQRLGNSARIGLILSPDGIGDPPDDPMYQGVMAALQPFSEARIVQAARAQPGILSGEEAASVLLKANPSVNILVCATAPITEGAAQVVVDQGRVGRVLIVGTDESAAIDRLVDKGVILASIVRDSRKMGQEAVQAFTQSRAGVLAHKAVEVGFTVRERQEPPP